MCLDEAGAGERVIVITVLCADPLYLYQVAQKKSNPSICSY